MADLRFLLLHRRGGVIVAKDPLTSKLTDRQEATAAQPDLEALILASVEAIDCARTARRQFEEARVRACEAADAMRDNLAKCSIPPVRPFPPVAPRRHLWPVAAGRHDQRHRW
jgi:hypothetical protein